MLDDMESEDNQHEGSHKVAVIGLFIVAFLFLVGLSYFNPSK